MSKPGRAGKILSFLMVAAGIILIGLNILAALKWKYVQSKMLGEYYETEKMVQAVSMEEQEISDTGPPVELLPGENEVREESKTIQLFSREDYKSGMMVLSIPKLDVSSAVMEGTSIELLKQGVGLYDLSPLPGSDGGNVCIAGHRTTYGAWFRRVNELTDKDTILLEFQGHQYIYQVEKIFIVEKNDWSVTEPSGYSAITLTACHPMGSDRQRIVVRGRQKEAG